MQKSSLFYSLVWHLIFSIALIIAALSALAFSHSIQKFLVALIGFNCGIFNLILLGNNIASPTAIASPTSNSENWFEMKKNADKSTFFLSIICKKQDILSV